MPKEMEFLEASDVARILDVDNSTIYEWVKRKLLRAIEIPSQREDLKWSKYRFKREWIDEFIQNTTTKTVFDKEVVNDSSKM